MAILKKSDFMGMRQSAVVETLLFIIIALTIDYNFFDGTRYWQTRPHPFWIIVILMSVQYGTYEGLFATLLSSTVLLLGNLPEQKITQDIYDYLFEVSINPLMWLSASVVFGEVRRRQIQKEQKLTEDLFYSRKREDALRSDYEKVNSLKNALENQLAGHMRTTISIYNAAKRMQVMEPTEVLNAAVQLVNTMRPEKFSIFLLRDSTLEAVITENWGHEDGFSRRFTQDSAIYQEVIGRQRLLCIVDVRDEKIMGGEGILAAPLINRDTGEIFGLLKVERLGFLDLNMNTIENFKVISEWIGTAYSRALNYKTALSDSFINPENKLLSYSFFKHQTDFLVRLARRLKFDVTMIVIGVRNADALTEDDRNHVPLVVSETIKKVLRTTDMAFGYQLNGGQDYAVVLPATPSQNVQIVVNKIQGELSALMTDAQFSFTIEELHKQG